MSERDIQTAVRLAVGRLPGVVLWRNNVGVSERWNGRAPERIVYGLAPGSADLVGLVMREDGFGRFIALEVKTPAGRISPEQKLWHDLVNRLGGYAAVVRSVEEAITAVELARNGDRL